MSVLSPSVPINTTGMIVLTLRLLGMLNGLRFVNLPNVGYSWARLGLSLPNLPGEL